MVCLEWEAGGKLRIEQKHYQCLWPFALPFSSPGWEVSYLAAPGPKCGPTYLGMKSGSFWVGVINVNFDLFLLPTGRALQTQNGSSYDYQGLHYRAPGRW